MNIFITGGTGFIGSALVANLSQQGHNITVLSRNPGSVTNLCGADVNAVASLKELTSEDSWQVIINLAGAPIFDRRWTADRKQLIRDSRIKLTGELVAYIAGMAVKPELLISGSAIGYYGSQGDEILTEQSATIEDFPQQLCRDWENTALEAEQFGVRVCLMRTGLVIANGGGILQRMLAPFRLGLGGRLGDGKQWMSWVHRQDWVAIAQMMIADASMRGAYNATAPNPVTNSEFTETLAHHLNRPALLPAPAWLLKMLLGEMSELVLGSQRVMPERLLAAGYTFQHPDLRSALSEALNHE